MYLLIVTIISNQLPSRISEHSGVWWVQAGRPDARPAAGGGLPLGLHPLRPLHPRGRRAADSDGAQERAQAAHPVRQVAISMKSPFQKVASSV